MSIQKAILVGNIPNVTLIEFKDISARYRGLPDGSSQLALVETSVAESDVVCHASSSTSICQDSTMSHIDALLSFPTKEHLDEFIYLLQDMRYNLYTDSAAETTALSLVLTERTRQIEEEGFTTEKDLQYTDNSLSKAAACYAMPPAERDNHRSFQEGFGTYPRWWPISLGLNLWKPSPNNRLKELAKAGALILADMQRIIKQINS